MPGGSPRRALRCRGAAGSPGPCSASSSSCCRRACSRMRRDSRASTNSSPPPSPPGSSAPPGPPRFPRARGAESCRICSAKGSAGAGPEPRARRALGIAAGPGGSGSGAGRDTCGLSPPVPGRLRLFPRGRWARPFRWGHRHHGGHLVSAGGPGRAPGWAGEHRERLLEWGSDTGIDSWNGRAVPGRAPGMGERHRDRLPESRGGPAGTAPGTRGGESPDGGCGAVPGTRAGGAPVGP